VDRILSGPGRPAGRSADEIEALIRLIVAINAWNTLGVSARAWEPGSYQP
jgi:hypothetical protein